MWPFPKKRDFYKMLSLQAEKVEEGMASLYDFALLPTLEKGEKVKRIENEADDLRKNLIEELNLSFVTPIDREDIFSLSRTIDDICDYAQSTVEEMLLFGVDTNPHIQKMTEILYSASKEIALSVRLMEKDPKLANSHLLQAKKTENYVEHLYRQALVELFKTSDQILILKLREIYRHLSNAADRTDEAANIIGDILVKTT